MRDLNEPWENMWGAYEAEGWGSTKAWGGHERLRFEETQYG